MNKQTIGVIGAGQMGTGIATLCAVHDYTVKVVDATAESLQKSKYKIQSYLESKSIAFEQVTFHTDINALADADIVIEAVPEKRELKELVYATLVSVVKPTTIIATNTSSFPILDLSTSVTHPERFLGIHFMNPVLKMELVEVIPSIHTGAQTLEVAQTFVGTLNKTMVTSEDQPGFIVNRLLIPMINQAFIALENNLASKEDIDTAMEKGAAFPMGPLKLADFIGLDTCLSIMNTLNFAFPKSGYTPSELLMKYVSEGKLGRKTKEGVYSY